MSNLPGHDSSSTSASSRPWPRRIALAFVSIALAYGLLLIPEGAPSDGSAAAQGVPFVWDQDPLWDRLEARFVKARKGGCASLAGELVAGFDGLEQQLQTLHRTRDTIEVGDPLLESIGGTFFSTAAVVAACPEHAERMIALYGRLRADLKAASVRWPMEKPAVRRALYRLLYGGRMAVEEVLLQLPPAKMPVLMKGTDTPSKAPSKEILGVRVHSGDILLSRGGAPTSALIARGNDYPGNFSHVALVHIDEAGTFRTIESHIEVGVVVEGLEKYTTDPKLRVMLLRPRPGLLDAHVAATQLMKEAQERHIPYDFAMNYDDPEEMFCSEVASRAYKGQGVSLWKGLTTMSSPATARWLSAFGVRNFTTYGPSDLEYDPQLVVVAEWRDPATLYGDHVDNAILDALLESAQDHGTGVGHNALMVPVARVLKGISWVLNRFGAHWIVPEGMSATTALRAEWLGQQHGKVKKTVLERARAFQSKNGYRPPYWRLVTMADEVVAGLVAGS